MEPILVIQSGGWSYARLNNQPYHATWKFDMTGWLINGQPAVQSEADSRWAYIEGPITSIEQPLLPTQQRVRWEANETARVLVEKGLIPDTLPPETRMADEDDLAADFHSRMFYHGVYEAVSQRTELMDFFVVNRDGPPKPFDLPAKTDGPEWLRDYPEMRWRYPCTLPAEEVFTMLREAILARVERLGPRGFDVNDFPNLQILTVRRWVELTWPETHQVDESAHGARKPRWVTHTIRGRMEPVLRLLGPKSYHEKDGTPVRIVKGDNLDDLKANLAVYIRSFADLLEPKEYCYCPVCHQGIIAKEDLPK